MSISIEALRGHYKISKLGQVFEATLHLCMEEGFPLHQLHYQPSPLILDDRGQRLVLPDAQVACIFGLTRFTPLDIPVTDQAAFARKPPFESLYLTLPVSECGKPNQRRVRFLQETENLFLDIAERKDRVFVEAISHRRLIHGQIVVRHQPVALLNSTGKLLWMHPEARRFGLLESGFPRSQKFRHLDGPAVHVRTQPGFGALDEDGLPGWYHEALQGLYETDGADPMAEALIGLQAQSLLQVSIEQEAEDRLRSVAQGFLTDFETYFGMGGLMPMPGILDPS